MNTGCFETMLVKNKAIKLMPFHESRFMKSIATLLPSFCCPDSFLSNAVKQHLNQKDTVLKAKWNPSLPEHISFEKRPIPLPKSTLKVQIKIKEAPQKVHPWIKYQERTFYNQSLNEARAASLDDYILITKEGWLLESCIANLLILMEDAICYTPPLNLGLVAGVKRASLLNSGQVRLKVNTKEHNYPIIEKRLHLNDLKCAKSIYLCNSIRGIQAAKISESSNHETHTTTKP